MCLSSLIVDGGWFVPVLICVVKRQVERAVSAEDRPAWLDILGCYLLIVYDLE
jgi:hypothetical protein